MQKRKDISKVEQYNQSLVDKFLDKYFEFMISIISNSIYAILLEIIIESKQNQGLIIIMSFFLTLFTNIQLENIKKYQISIITIIFQQLYTILRMQFFLQYDTLFLILNILYFIYQITQYNTSITTKNKKKIDKLSERSKAENIKALYQSILSVIPEGLAVLNQDKKLLYANPTLKKILQANKKSDIQNILINLGNSSSFISLNGQKSSTKVISVSKDKNNLDVDSGLSKNQDDCNHKLDNISTNNSEIVKDRKKKESILQPISQIINEKVPQQQPKQKNQALKTQCSIAWKSNEELSKEKHINDKKNEDQKDKVSNDLLKNIEMSSNQIVYHQQKEIVSHHYQKLNNSSSKVYDQGYNNDNQFQKVENQIKEINNQSQKVLSKEQINNNQQSRSSNQILRNINLQEQKKTKQRIISPVTSQSIQFGSDQSEILSYQGFGFNAYEEECNQPQNGVQSQQIIQQNKMCEQSKFNNEVNNISSQNQQQQSNFSMNNKPYFNYMSQQPRKKTQKNYTSIQFKKNINQSCDYKVDYYETIQKRTHLKTSTYLKEHLNQLNENNKQQDLNDQQQIDSNTISVQHNQANQTFNFFNSLNQQSNNQSITQNPNTDQKRKSEDSIPQQVDYAKTKLNNKQPFTFQIKSMNNQEVDSKLELKKTDVSHILDKIFANNQSKQNLPNNQPTIVVNDISQNNLLVKGIEKQENEYEQRNLEKKNSFISHIKKEEKEGMSYIQQTENVTKIQVKFIESQIFKQNDSFNKIFKVLQFISVDILQNNSKKDPLVLIMIQDMWQDLYQQKVEDIQKDKMRIFASLSHELRTPLNCSISMLEVLKDEVQETNPEYIEEYLNPALFSNKLLLNQINDILDFVQMDSGKFKYSFLEFNILNLLKDCQKLVSMQAQMKNIDIIINFDQNVPESICSDPNRIRQIILNFLSNSLKFTKQGYIEIGVNIIERGIYKLYVKDTGIGITKENLETIFSFCGKVNYEQKDAGLNTQGCGLGLTISNSIAKGLLNNKQIQGGIEVASEYGYGSTFSINIQDMNSQDQTLESNHSRNSKKRKDPINQMEISPSKFRRKSTTLKNEIHQKIKNQSEHFLNDISRKGDKKQLSSIHHQQVIIEDEYSSREIQNSSIDQFQQSRYYSYIENTPKYLDNVLAERSFLNPIIAANFGVNVFDSAVIIEQDEDEQTKRMDFNPNIKIQHCEKFQEDSFNSLKDSNHQNRSGKKIKSIQKIPQFQSKQLDLMRFLDIRSLSMKQDYNNMNNDNNSNTNNKIYNSAINNRNSTYNNNSLINISIHTNSVQGNNENNNNNQNCNDSNNTDTESNVYVDNAVSLNYFDPKQQSDLSVDIPKKQQGFSNLSLNLRKLKTNSTYKDEFALKQNQDQEGFTSYVAFNKIAELGPFSSRQIFSQNKIVMSKQQIQMSIVQADEKFSKQTSINSSINSQKVINGIMSKNNMKKQICNCPQILIVDDNQFNLYALAKTIQQFQFSYFSLSDGAQAVEYVQEYYQQNCCKAPKVIFMDIEMPIKNGYEATKEINQFYKSIQFKEPPIIIACTAYVGQEDQETAIKAGMSDFINKPILKNAFQQLILNWKDLFF